MWSRRPSSRRWWRRTARPLFGRLRQVAARHDECPRSKLTDDQTTLLAELLDALEARLQGGRQIGSYQQAIGELT